MRKREEIEEAFAPREELDHKSSFFLVGIGGAGMSALARMLHRRGFKVSGSDSTPSPDVERLIRDGIQVTIGHTGAHLEREPFKDKLAVVLTDAIDLKASPEVKAAKLLGIPIFRRSQALGWLLRDKKVIAVTGTHGKTTTTGLVGSALVAAGMDPLVVVGANVPDFGGPVREGDGAWAVVEACEAYDALHDLDPHDVVLTNLELDHVDFHGNYENLRESMLKFIRRIPADGSLIYCAEDEGATDVAARFDGMKVDYRLNGGKDISMEIPGRHNKLNMEGALKAAKAAGADPEMAKSGVSSFGGAERRLQVLQQGEIVVVDDYAHHPTEIEASLKALRDRYPNRRIVVVYQPHLYSRTAPLIDQFAQALGLADVVVITDIYPARELPMPGVSSARIAEKLDKPVSYVPSRHLLPRTVATLAAPGDVIVGMGAGNISEFAPALIKELSRAADASRPVKVAVLYGGDSAEREVSLHSGREIQESLCRTGFSSELIDLTEALLAKGEISKFIGEERPDVAFLAVHGTHAEDGAIQGFLELMHIPYTGSGIQASAIAMDKALTKQILERNGIRAPKGQLLDSPSEEVTLDLPLVVKPNAQGSTVGLSFVRTLQELRPAILRAFSYGTSVVVEEWIEGVEISVPILDDEALIPVEIAPASGKYDFESKYTPGATNEIIPARLPEEVLARAKEIALEAHRAIGCSGATRTDAIVRDGEIFVLEVNTLPGMTKTSLLPNSAAAAGIDFDQLCRRLIQDALKRNAAKT